jgi:hypothetical protein
LFQVKQERNMQAQGQARVRTVAFQGVGVVPVDVQVLIGPGQLAFAMVGLAAPTPTARSWRRPPNPMPRAARC